MAINLYESDFPGFYYTEDGYMVDELGNVYDDRGTCIEEEAIDVYLEEDNDKPISAGKFVGTAAGVGAAGGTLAGLGSSLVKSADKGRGITSTVAHANLNGMAKAAKYGATGALIAAPAYAAYRAGRYLYKKAAPEPDPRYPYQKQ